MIDYDPGASFGPQRVAVTVKGHDFELAAMPAAEWLDLFFDPEFTYGSVFPDLFGWEAQEKVTDLLLSGELGVDECVQVAKDVMTLAAGRPWWFAVRMVAVARQNWELVGGELALAGVRAETMSLGMWLDAVYLIVIRATKPQQAAMVESRLKQPPMEERQANFDEEEEAAAFMAALGAQLPH